MTKDVLQEISSGSTGGLWRRTAGTQFRIDEPAARKLLLTHRVQSSSRRGSVLVLGNVLVRLSDESGVWVVTVLPWEAGRAEVPGHEHHISAYRMPDGYEVLYCMTCGTEW